MSYIQSDYEKHVKSTLLEKLHKVTGHWDIPGNAISTLETPMGITLHFYANDWFNSVRVAEAIAEFYPHSNPQTGPKPKAELEILSQQDIEEGKYNQTPLKGVRAAVTLWYDVKNAQNDILQALESRGFEQTLRNFLDQGRGRG